MACDTQRKSGQTAPQRTAEIVSAVERLERSLAIGLTKIKVGSNGAVVFVGSWASNRDGVSDVCAFRRLQGAGSAVLRRELARAEVTAGRKMDPRAVAAGTHSHDGGKTWDPGH